MCEDHYHDPDLETDSDDSDLDMLEYFEWNEEPPRKPKYYPASAPTPLADRLAYYKYELKFRKFCSDMHALFTRLEFGADKQPKKKLLCVRIGTEYFVLDPQSAGQEQSVIGVEMYGIIQRYPSAPPSIKLNALVVAKNDLAMHEKFEYLRHHMMEARTLSAKICGQQWFLTDVDTAFTPEYALGITFTLPSDVKQMMHQRLREAEAKHKERFAKFAALT